MGLGTDGLSSSSYSPEETFKSLGSHTDLVVFLALATAFTIVVISYAYSRIIEHFSHGGGRYVVSTHTLGEGRGRVKSTMLLIKFISVWQDGRRLHRE